ncbi:MAG: hypothetical protein ACFFAE_06585 [Candidatus Hodarchaeota archaeon]
MSRLKLLFQRIRKSEKKTEEREEEAVKPARGWRRVITTFLLYFPLGMYQRGLDWQLDDSPSPTTHTTNGPNESNLNGKIIHIHEKSFRSRFSYLCSRTLLQSVGLSIVFTAPISLPWIFNIVIPFSIDLLPFGLAEIVREIINNILTFLAPFSIIADIIMVISNFFGTANPIFFYGSTLWFLSMIGIIDIKVFEDFDNSQTDGSASMIELMANHYQSKFALIQEVLAPFLLLVACSVSFFLVIRSARKIIFEVQTEKEQEKNIKNIKKTLISHYFDEGYSEVKYRENRITASTKLIWLARIIKYGPIVSVALPILLAILFVIF